MNPDRPLTGVRRVHRDAKGRPYVDFCGTRIASTHLEAYVGDRVRVHDGYGELWSLSEWLDPPRVYHGRNFRMGKLILEFTLVSERGRAPRWSHRPYGGETWLDDRRFIAQGRALQEDFGTLEEETCPTTSSAGTGAPG